METIFQDKTPSERLQLLRENAATVEKQSVKVMFTEDELAEMKHNLSDISILENELKEELKEVSSDLKAKIKSEREQIKGLLTYLKNKYILQTQEVYLMDDQDAGLMNTYNAEGMLIESRKLRPSERQTRIKSLNKTA